MGAPINFPDKKKKDLNQWKYKEKKSIFSDWWFRKAKEGNNYDSVIHTIKKSIEKNCMNL